jgi:hypothetical protein
MTIMTVGDIEVYYAIARRMRSMKRRLFANAHEALQNLRIVPCCSSVKYFFPNMKTVPFPVNMKTGSSSPLASTSGHPVAAVTSDRESALVQFRLIFFAYETGLWIMPTKVMNRE